jgi:hypothetical protein
MGLAASVAGRVDHQHKVCAKQLRKPTAFAFFPCIFYLWGFLWVCPRDGISVDLVQFKRGAADWSPVALEKPEL